MRSSSLRWLVSCPLAWGLGCSEPSTPVAPSEPSEPVVVSEATTDPPEPTQAATPATTDTPEGGTLVRPTNAAPPEPGTIPQVEWHEPVVGTTGAEEIRRVVRTHLAEIRACYDASLANDPQRRGLLKIEFVIGPTGVVEGATASDPTGLGDPELSTCIEAAIESWVFPQPRGGGRVIVSYPFNFVPE